MEGGYNIVKHSHMKADQTTALCKKSLAKKDLYIPDQIKDSMNTVANMHADVLVEDDFYNWERLLKRYFKPAPGGFTAYYCMEFAGGKMIYKRLASDPDIDGQEHIFVQNTEATQPVRLFSKSFWIYLLTALWKI